MAIVALNEYATIETVPISWRGMLHIVTLPAEVKDLGLLKGPAVIDGNAVMVRGVEAFMHCSPWRKGERVGLLL